LTYRSYVDVVEFLSLLLCLAFDCNDGVTQFDVAGEDVMEIEDLIATIFEVLNVKVDVVRPELNGEIDRYIGSANLYSKMLMAYSIKRINIREQIATTSAYIYDKIRPF
jgi:hypothetical protein